MSDRVFFRFSAATRASMAEAAADSLAGGRGTGVLTVTLDEMTVTVDRIPPDEFFNTDAADKLREQVAKDFDAMLMALLTTNIPAADSPPRYPQRFGPFVLANFNS